MVYQVYGKSVECCKRETRPNEKRRRFFSCSKCTRLQYRRKMRVGYDRCAPSLGNTVCYAFLRITYRCSIDTARLVLDRTCRAGATRSDSYTIYPTLGLPHALMFFFPPETFFPSLIIPGTNPAPPPPAMVWTKIDVDSLVLPAVYSADPPVHPRASFRVRCFPCATPVPPAIERTTRGASGWGCGRRG